MVFGKMKLGFIEVPTSFTDDAFVPPPIVEIYLEF